MQSPVMVMQAKACKLEVVLCPQETCDPWLGITCGWPSPAFGLGITPPRCWTTLQRFSTSKSLKIVISWMLLMPCSLMRAASAVKLSLVNTLHIAAIVPVDTCFEQMETFWIVFSKKME